MKTKNKKSTQNNNNDVELKKPLNSTQDSEKANSNGSKAKPGPVIQRETTHEQPEPAAVVKHFRNRGNDRYKNGINGNGGSHKSSQASSVGLLETSDLFESVFDRKSGSYGRKSLVSADRKSAETSDQRSTSSSERNSATSSDQKTVASVDRRSNDSCDRKSRHSLDRQSDSLNTKGHHEYNGKINGDLNESQTDGIMISNKRPSPKYCSSDFM